MFESTTDFFNSLSKLGFKIEMREVKANKVLIIGQAPLKLDKILENVSLYNRSGGDCFESTEQEIKTGKATGGFVNLIGRRHALPAVKKGEIYAAYDDLLIEGNGHVIFLGSEIEVGKAIENFYQISGYPHGRGFVFKEKV